MYFRAWKRPHCWSPRPQRSSLVSQFSTRYSKSSLVKSWLKDIKQWLSRINYIAEQSIKPRANIVGQQLPTLNTSWLVPRETVNFVSRGFFMWKFWSWKFIKARCNGGRRSPFAGNSALLPSDVNSDVIDLAMLSAFNLVLKILSLSSRNKPGRGCSHGNLSQ